MSGVYDEKDVCGFLKFPRQYFLQENPKDPDAPDQASPTDTIAGRKLGCISQDLRLRPQRRRLTLDAAQPPFFRNAEPIADKRCKFVCIHCAEMQQYRAQHGATHAKDVIFATNSSHGFTKIFGSNDECIY